MGIDRVLFEDNVIQKLTDTIKASELLTSAVEQKKPTEGAITCFSAMRNRFKDAHTDLMHNPELAKQKQTLLQELIERLKCIRSFYEAEYSIFAPIQSVAPPLYERMNINLEMARIRTIASYVKDMKERINSVSYEQLRTGGNSEKALETIEGMINARKETIMIEAIKKQYHANGVLACCCDTNRQTAEDMFREKFVALLAQPHGQFEVIPQFNPQAQSSLKEGAPPQYDPFAPSASIKMNNF